MYNSLLAELTRDNVPPLAFDPEVIGYKTYKFPEEFPEKSLHTVLYYFYSNYKNYCNQI